MLQVGSAEPSKADCSIGRTTAHLSRCPDPKLLKHPNASEKVETQGSSSMVGWKEAGVAMMKKNGMQMRHKIENRASL